MSRYSNLKTINGVFRYKQRLLYLGNHVLHDRVIIENLKIISPILDKTGIAWGPAFGTLIGIVRNNNVLPWASTFNIYILKEDEERFKETLSILEDLGFKLVRYERRGLYYLERRGEYFKIFVLHKISSDVRYTGGIDFIHEKYVQNTVKWDFEGIKLNVPADLDEYLTFQYGDWVVPSRTSDSKVQRYIAYISAWVQDHLPDGIYFKWLKTLRQNRFETFKHLCQCKGQLFSSEVEFSSIRPRRYKRILTVGVYDLIHKGHVELYRRAKALGDYLIVAVQESEYILKYKPDSKVLNSTEDRMYMVKSIKYVNEVVSYGDVDDIVKHIDFDVFVTGPDQFHDGFQRAVQWCEANGKQHVIIGRTEGISSSELKARIAGKLKNNSNR